MKRPTFKEFKEEVLKNPEVRKAYNKLKPHYNKIRKLIESKIENK